MVWPWTLFAQELVPVTNRRHVGWGNHPGQMSVPDDRTQKVNDSSPDQANEELPEYMGGPTRQFDTITQRYNDGSPQIVRQVMQDQAGSFLNHGQWKLYNRRGSVLAEGEFREGRMDSAWQRWHPADSQGLFREAPFHQFPGPFLSIATFSDGKLNGTWTIFDRTRRKIFEMPYSNGQRNGRAIWFRPNGQSFREVDFKDGQLHGQLIEYDREDSTTRDATYDKGQELITRTSNYFKDQKRTEQSFLGPRMEFLADDDWWNANPAHYESIGEELQHGPTREWYPNGQLRVSGQYRQGFKVGSFRWWHDNGQKQIEGQFQQGARSGTWAWWHTNSRKAIEGDYDNDVEVGLWTWWNEFGELEDQKNFSLESLDPLESLNIENIESLESIDEDPLLGIDT